MALFATKDVNLKIEGMTCGHCVATVGDAIQTVSGVKKAEIDLEAGSAWVRVKAEADAAAIVDAITQAGYRARIA